MAKIIGYDFCGWATKNDMKCSDGRTIRKNAFASDDGKKVPLIWNHKHDSVDDVLGHAILENRENGVYAYCFLNNTEGGKNAKEALKHGDVESLSIWANSLVENAGDVTHGVIRELSLVLAGANPGAFIESVVAHGIPMDIEDEEGIIYTGEGISFEAEGLQHADEDGSSDDKKDDPKDNKSNGDKTVGDVFNTLNEDQKMAVAIIVDQAVENAKKENSGQDKEEGGDGDMAHNIFDQDDKKEKETTRYLSHADGVSIIENAKRIGSLKVAFREFAGDDIIAHAVPMDGMTPTSENKNYGVNGIDMLLPEFRNQNIPPEFISRDMGWVSKVLAGTHKLPYQRIKSMYADITEDEARAKGYVKGDQKYPEVFSILTRTTDAQMIYKLQKLDRQDILEITDFDMVPWIKNEMDIMLDEEKARAILIGDGRLTTDRFKIKEDRIRPIVSDVDLFNVKVKVKATGTTGAEIAEETIDSIIRARKRYKGSGNPTFFTTEDVVTEMLLIKDKIGHRVYKTMEELKTTLRVSDIVTVEPMSGYKIDGDELVGVIVNLRDYAVGQNPRAKRDMFEDFDIDFNKYTYLKEEMCSGALIKPFSALTITLSGGTLSEEVAP